MDLDDDFDPMLYKAKEKPKSDGPATRGSALKGSSRSTEAQRPAKTRPWASPEVGKDLYGLNSNRGKHEDA